MIGDGDYLGVGNDRTTRSRQVLTSIEESSGSDVVRKNDIVGGEREIEINVDGVAGEGVDSRRAERSQIYPTLRDLMILDDHKIDEPCSTTAAPLHYNHPSTLQANPKVAAERLNLEKQQDSELEAYILEKVSLLQPSSTTLFEPSVAADNKSEQKAVSESKWKKKIEDAIAKLTTNPWSTGKKQQKADPHPGPNEEAILYERDVKGILNMRWEEDEKKRGAMKQRRRRATSCICFLSIEKKTKDWEFQLEEYSYAW